MGKSTPKYEDLFQVLRQFDVNLEENRDPSRFNEWEQTVLKATLEDLNCTNIVFSMGERDSFGPLTRVVTLEKDGDTRHLIYG